MTSVKTPGRPPSQLAKTFDNGLRVLVLLARAPGGRTATEVAADLGLERTAVYRLLATAAARRLVQSDAHGRYQPGPGLLELAASFRADLRDTAVPHLAALAEELGATTFLTVADGDEGVSVSVCAPLGAPMHVAYRTGFRHPLQRGAPGIAILAGLPPRPGEPEVVARARTEGWVATHGELQPGASGIACPLALPGLAASVGVVALAPIDAATAVPRIRSAVAAIRAARM